MTQIQIDAMNNTELQTAIVRTYQLLKESHESQLVAKTTGGKPPDPDMINMQLALHGHLIKLLDIQQARAAQAVVKDLPAEEQPSLLARIITRFAKANA